MRPLLLFPLLPSLFPSFLIILSRISHSERRGKREGVSRFPLPLPLPFPGSTRAPKQDGEHFKTTTERKTSSRLFFSASLSGKQRREKVKSTVICACGRPSFPPFRFQSLPRPGPGENAQNAHAYLPLLFPSSLSLLHAHGGSEKEMRDKKKKR